MSSAAEAYQSAHKAALAALAARKKENLDPYLPVLDHYLSALHIVSTRRFGSQEIQLRRIVGTCHEGRTEAFAYNFMPLLEENSEFAAKWMRLYSSALEEGLRDPIRVYLLYGRYFVEEGNKRVSVMKALNNPLIAADVYELTVVPDGLPDGPLYAAYLHFSAQSGISTILMSRKKNYAKLASILGINNEHTLSAEDRKTLISLFDRFEALYDQRISSPIPASAGDAFLILLEVFGWLPGKIYTDSELSKEFDAILPAILAWPTSLRTALLTQSELSSRKPSALFSFLSEPVRAVLIEPGSPETSLWTKAHDEAFRQMAQSLSGKVEIRIFNDCDSLTSIDNALKQAVEWKADVVFTAHPLMLQATNLYAARYPKIRFLNCSLNPESTAVRSYYTRGYELQFLQGMAAGALSTTGRLGYIADYPIYGAIADINAFAIGAMMVRPDVKVYLDWSTSKHATNQEFPVDIDLLYIAGQDFDTRLRKGKSFGLFDVRTGQFARLSTVNQKWDVFYTRIIASILNHTYQMDAISQNTNSINYWLGLSNGLMDVHFSDVLPDQTRRLIRRIRDDITEERFFIFDGLGNRKDGYSGHNPLDMEEICRMDWFVSSIVGILPDPDDLTEYAKNLVRIHGVELEEEQKAEENTKEIVEQLEEHRKEEQSSRQSEDSSTQASSGERV